MKKRSCVIALLFVVLGSLDAQTVFSVTHPDKTLSPFTGMTRQHWKDAAKYLLEGAFSHVHDINDPMLFPKQPGKSYPKRDEQIPVAKLEGLCRTMFIAGPLLKEDPDLQMNGIRVGDYYRHQIIALQDSSSECFIPNRSPNGGPSQTLVEFGGLAVSLMLAPEVFWDPLAKPVKEALTIKMLSYGEGPTIAMNWQFFNINIMSFFKSRGYTVKEDYLKELVKQTLESYRGDGWYNDSPYFDYYSMWAFQMYGSLWAEYFGKKYYPEYANQFIDHLHDLANHYPYMFGRDGKMIMWGRSISYRMGAAIPFPLLPYTNDTSINYGWMRRIASATILQFLTHPDFMQDHVPTLGFYDAFEPAVQTYSCRGSVFWMGKLFLGLFTPANSPFWTATENEGPWKDSLQPGEAYNQLEQHTDILITDYPGIGAAEIRATTNSKNIGVYQGTENYNRLSYNSVFPWQADGPGGEVAMNYLLKKDNDTVWEAGRMFTFDGYKEGIYQRKLVMANDTSIQLQLAEMTLPNGILRVDKIRSSTPVMLRLGHYALPEFDQPVTITNKKVKGHDVIIIDNGKYSLAMVNVQGWTNLETKQCTGLHPESSKSVVINAAFYHRGSSQILTSLMLWNNAGHRWKKRDLLPVKKLKETADGKQVMRVLKNKTIAVSY